eukprot:316051-Amphidinium_carterae.2
MSPWSFIVCLEPPIKCLWYERELRQRPHVVLKACADDLAWTLCVLQDLLMDLDTLEQWHEATVLRLNHRKCVIIPCGVLSPQELQARWQDMLRSVGQEVRYQFAVVSSARYLGVVLGDG